MPQRVQQIAATAVHSCKIRSFDTDIASRRIQRKSGGSDGQISADHEYASFLGFVHEEPEIL